jgi:hypothetical protein
MFWEPEYSPQVMTAVTTSLEPSKYMDEMMVSQATFDQDYFTMHTFLSLPPSLSI